MQTISRGMGMSFSGPFGPVFEKKSRGTMLVAVLMTTLLSVALAPGARAMDPELVRSDDQDLLVLQLENDEFARQDNGYTNGFRATVIPGTADAPAWLRSMAGTLTPVTRTGARSPWSWSISQVMFTPDDIENPRFPPDDRAYAGWLQASASLFTLTETELERFRMSLGTVGPASGAEQAQKQIHEALGSARPVGWDSQLPNEPTVQFSYDRQWRMIRDTKDDGLVLEMTPTFGATLGNARAGVEAGGFLRIGDNIPVDFGPQRIKSLAGGSGYYKPVRGFGWYAYAGVAGHLAPHNIFLDGSLVRSTPGVEVDRDPYFGQLYAGFACYHGPTRVGLVAVSETDRFEDQPRENRFGALTISWRI